MPTEAIKIKVNADDLDAKLSKSMRELGAHHDQYGRLLNAEGKYIGTLSQANVRMGHYIDSQGKMRDAAGRLVEGLTAAEKALRMYIDAHGDVRTAEGEFVRASDAKVKALEESRKAAASTLSNLSQLSASMATLATVFEHGGKEVASLAKAMKEIAGGASAVLSFSGTVATLTNSLRNLAKTKNFLGGFPGIFTAATLAVAGSIYAFEKLTKVASDSESVLNREIDSIKRLADAYANLRDSIARTGSVNAAFSSSQETTVDELKKLQEQELEMRSRQGTYENNAKYWRRESVKLEQENEEKSIFNPTKYLSAYKTEMTDAQERSQRADQELKELRDSIKANKEAQYNSVLKMLKSDLESNPTKELADRARFYLEQIKNNGIQQKNLGLAQEALTNVFRQYSDKFKVDSVSKLNEAITQASKDFGETSDAFRSVSDNLRRAYDKQKLVQSEGYIESLREQMKTPTDRLREEQEKLKEAYKAGAVSFHELAEMNSFLRDKYEEKAAAEDSPQPVWKEPDYHAPKSAAYGSQQLYEMLTQRNQDAWRDKMQSAVSDMKAQNEEANEYLRDMRDGILAFRDVGVTA